MNHEKMTKHFYRTMLLSTLLLAACIHAGAQTPIPPQALQCSIQQRPHAIGHSDGSNSAKFPQIGSSTTSTPASDDTGAWMLPSATVLKTEKGVVILTEPNHELVVSSSQRLQPRIVRPNEERASGCPYVCAPTGGGGQICWREC